MPRNTEILMPVFALAAWTMFVLILVAYRRVTTSLAARISPNEYALGESPRVPASVVLVNRNYMNLLELPVLFYVACLLAFVTGSATGAVVPLAWAYVGLRCIHTFIHVTYNKVLHRFAAFAISNFTLAFLWVSVALHIFHGSSAA